MSSLFDGSRDEGPGAYGCGSKPMVPFWFVGAPPILEPILVKKKKRSSGVRDFDPWPYNLES